MAKHANHGKAAKKMMGGKPMMHSKREMDRMMGGGRKGGKGKKPRSSRRMDRKA